MVITVTTDLPCDACGASPCGEDDILCVDCRERVRARSVVRSVEHGLPTNHIYVITAPCSEVDGEEASFYGTRADADAAAERHRVVLGAAALRHIGEQHSTSEARYPDFRPSVPVDELPANRAEQVREREARLECARRRAPKKTVGTAPAASKTRRSA